MTEFDIKHLHVTLTTKSVNDKRLFTLINDLVIELLQLYSFSLSPNSLDKEFLQVSLEAAMIDLTVNNIISQWDIIWDTRNNSYTNIMSGKQQIIVKFKQNSCLNTTQLIYDIIDTDFDKKRD